MRVSVLLDNKLCQEEPVDGNGENAIFCIYYVVANWNITVEIVKQFVRWILQKYIAFNDDLKRSCNRISLSPIHLYNPEIT